MRLPSCWPFLAACWPSVGSLRPRISGSPLTGALPILIQPGHLCSWPAARAAAALRAVGAPAHATVSAPGHVAPRPPSGTWQSFLLEALSADRACLPRLLDAPAHPCPADEGLPRRLRATGRLCLTHWSPRCVCVLPTSLCGGLLTATMQPCLVKSLPLERGLPCRDTERWPAGDYTIQSAGGEGLGKWTQQVWFRVQD